MCLYKFIKVTLREKNVTGNKATNPGPSLHKTFLIYRVCDTEEISNRVQASAIKHHLPDHRRENLALIYLDQRYLTSGAIITIKHVLYLSTGKIKFKNTGKPSENYTVEIQSFMKIGLQPNIYNIKMKIADCLDLEIVEVSIFLYGEKYLCKITKLFEYI